MGSKKIKLSGWQSWTHCKNPLLKLRIRNYSPFEDDNVSVETELTNIVREKVVGWCSWPYFGTNISESKILGICEWLVKNNENIPVEYILVDDGWAKWGDWLMPDSSKFQNGMKSLAEDVKAMGFMPGLWVAPLLVDPNSGLFKRHAGWIVKNSRKGFIDGLKNYSFDKLLPRKRYILDLENDEAYEYILGVFRTIIRKWGYKLLKIDFLYAGHFNPAYKSSAKPDNLLRRLLLDIRNIDKEVVLMACGCPLLPAAGVVDSMRICDDVIIPQLKHVPIINKLFHKHRLRQLKDNLHAREETSSLWLLDPDIFVCSKKFGLTDKDLINFQTLVRAASGVVMLGDNLTELSQNELDRYILPLF